MLTTTNMLTIENVSEEWLQVANLDLLQHTNPHWLQFKPPTCFHHTLIALVYIIIGIPGLLGNLLMIITFFSSSSLRVHTNVMNINLAIADLLMNMEIPFLISNSLHCGPVKFSVFSCQVYGFTGALSGTVAIASITGMSYQRFITITRPFEGARILNFNHSVLSCLFAWIYGLTFAIIPIVMDFTSYVPEGYLTSCSFDYLSTDVRSRLFILIFGVAAYAVPMILIIFFYVRIMHEVHVVNHDLIQMTAMNSVATSSGASGTNSMATNTDAGSNRNKSTKDHNSSALTMSVNLRSASAYEVTLQNSKLSMEKKLLRSIATLVCCWIVAWTPYAIVSMAGILSYASLITPVTSMMPALLAKCASVADPYLYFYSHPRYRNEIWRLFSRLSVWPFKLPVQVSISVSRAITVRPTDNF